MHFKMYFLAFAFVLHCVDDGSLILLVTAGDSLNMSLWHNSAVELDG